MEGEQSRLKTPCNRNLKPDTRNQVSGKENNRGFVERTIQKIKPDKLPCKKTPGIVRLMEMIDYKVCAHVRVRETRQTQTQTQTQRQT